MRIKKSGYSLVELSVVMGVMVSMSLVNLQEGSIDRVQRAATSMGLEVQDYQRGVSRYLSDVSGMNAEAMKLEKGFSDVAPSGTVERVFTGSRWLKGPECNVGLADQDYLSCYALVNDRTAYYHSQPTTTVRRLPSGVVEARTVWSRPLSDVDIEPSGILGVAAMVATGNIVTQPRDMASAYAGPSIYCPDLPSYSHSMSDYCGLDRDRLVSMARTDPSINPWLRVDHGNTSKSIIEFGESRTLTSSLLSEYDDGESVEDGVGNLLWAGSGARQIANVARIYNRGQSGSDSLIIGSSSGMGVGEGDNLDFLSGDPVINLFENSVIMDGDLAAMQDIYVKGNSFAGDYVATTHSVDHPGPSGIPYDPSDPLDPDHPLQEGDVYARGSIRAISDILAQGELHVGGKVEVLGNLLAEGGITTQEYLHLANIPIEIDTACDTEMFAGLMARDSEGKLARCREGGSWGAVTPDAKMVRYAFTESGTWTVPEGVKSALVTMAGGGGSGLGYQWHDPMKTGASGGFVFSHPVNVVPGEDMQVIVGQGGRAGANSYGGLTNDGLFNIHIAPSASIDNGWAGFPGTASRLVSPSNGVLLECAGGSGRALPMPGRQLSARTAGRTDNETLPLYIWEGSSDGTNRTYFTSRRAAGSFTVEDGPGSCGPGGYGEGVNGTSTYGYSSGTYDGGLTPFGYGSGGAVYRTGCRISPGGSGRCTWARSGRDGVVFIDAILFD